MTGQKGAPRDTLAGGLAGRGCGYTEPKGWRYDPSCGCCRCAVQRVLEGPMRRLQA